MVTSAEITPAIEASFTKLLRGDAMIRHGLQHIDEAVIAKKVAEGLAP